VKHTLRRSLLLACIAGAACGGDDGAPVPPPPQGQGFSATGGAGQSAIAGTTLPVPYTVQVTDEADAPVPGATIHWMAGTAAGTLSASTSVTDATGRASVLYTLGAGTGSQTVSASIDGSSQTPVVFSATALGAAAAVRVAMLPIPPTYGIHDTFVRDGLAFVSAWDAGLIIYDVGNGIRGGSPSRPVEVSRIVPPAGVVTDMVGSIHNAWWFHNPVRNEKRYVFLGQEGPGIIGSGSRGDIYAVDVSDLAHPQVVGSFGITGAGTHNFWMDEAAQVLYAAYYNAGVVAIDVSGVLNGDLSSRLVAQVRPGGPDNTFTWGVQLANGSIYASDMLTGLWRLAPVSGGLAVLGGGRNVLERFTSDLWVQGGFAFTGTWGTRTDSTGQLNAGNALKVWLLLASGDPVLADSVILAGVGTVSDVETSASGARVLLTTERGSAAGFFIYALDGAGHPTPVTSVTESTGLHTGTFATIGGRDFVFAAKNPENPALVVYDVTGALH